VPGIAGIVSSMGRDSTQAILWRMGSVLPCQPGCSLQIWAGDQSGLVIAKSNTDGGLAIEPTGQGDGNVTLCVVGQIARDELFRQRMAETPVPDESPDLASCLLAIYKRFGVSGLQGLNGAYVTAVWEDLPGRMILVSDRGGMQPFYYFQQGQELVFASRQRAISFFPRFNKQINPAAVLDLLAAEQMLDERTLYIHLKALPPAAVLTFKNGRLEVQTYWQPRIFSAGDRRPSESEAVDGLVKHVLSAVELSLDLLRGKAGKSNLSQPGA
jgi:asparagine synthase (glutamine-hydrolysing)